MKRKDIPATDQQGELPARLQELFEAALGAHQAGRLAEAESLYNRLLEEQPDQPDTLNLLGVVALQTGRTDTAVACVGRALESRPRVPDYHFNLGLAYLSQGKHADAARSFRAATELKPDYAEAHNNLANVLKEEGKAEEASKHYRIALDINPHHPGAHNNLASLLKEGGQRDDAVIHFKKAVEHEPTFAEAHYNLGCTLYELHQYAPAVESFRNAVSIEPDFVDAHCNLGRLLRLRRQFVASTESFRRALVINPDMYAIHAELGAALKQQGLLDEALSSYRKSLALQPNRVAHSGLIHTMCCHPDFDAAAILAEARRWNECFVGPLLSEVLPFENDRSPDRRLKIAFLSPNFTRHPVGFFLSSVFVEHNRNEFEFICYSDVTEGDDLTELFMTHASQWHDIVGMEDKIVARRIREDRVDIVVELAGHFEGNRFLTLARRPAPIQMCGGGHFGTSGVDGVDYLISDWFHTPAGNDACYSENVLRLPDSYICFTPPSYAPPVSEPPARKRGCVTFGCYNNLAKITPDVLRLWAAILTGVPDSRLRLQTTSLGDSSVRERIRGIFDSYGIHSSRIELEGFVGHADLLENYGEIDIALDPFPYTGGLTTCEALWMGVPVITLSGTTFAGRHSTSHLSNVGLTELITDSREAYLALATDLARDLHRLEAIRGSLRDRMAVSPLCDAKRYTRNLESVFRDLWREWCRGS